MKKNLTILTVSACFLLVGFTAVQAQSGKAAEVKQSVKEKIVLKREVVKVKQCEVVEAKVEGKTVKLNENHENRLDSFKKTRDKLQKFITRLEDKGYDVEALRADLVTYDAKVSKYKSDYSTYLTLLRETKQFTCNNSESEFKAKLQAAREQQKVVQQDSVDTRTFYAKTFRAHTIDIKKQTALVEGDSAEEATTTNTTTIGGENVQN